MFPNLKNSIKKIAEIKVSEERKEILKPLADFIQIKLENSENINLNFICTHNSRRSHLSQIWAQMMAEYFGVKNVFCYSGGTEATAMYPKVTETLSKQGFQVQKLSETENPIYAVKFSENLHPVICFSKKFDDDFNPKSGFAAIMTCDSADENCPVVFGAEKRIPIKFEDPKKSDGTPEMDKIYFDRSFEIASEMYYVFSKIRK